MPVLTLYRDRPLNADERARLPKGCLAITGNLGICARAEVDLPTAELVAYAVQMGRAAPDARFTVHFPVANAEAPALAKQVPAPEALPVAVEPAGEVKQAPVGEGLAAAEPTEDGAAQGAPAEEAGGEDALHEQHDPWQLLDRGHIDLAEQVFAAGVTLDSAGRDRVRELVRSDDTALVALGARVARYADWRSFVGTLRQLLRHESPEVRVEAATGIGAMAGPAMLPTVEALASDPDPRVREAGQAAVQRIEGS